MTDHIPTNPPPSYDDATASSSASRHATNSSSSNHLTVPGSSSIPAEHRRSMEDLNRPLPKGWVRSYDDQTHHQFYVDTSKEPPRSIWVHPYDDENYLRTLSGEERERIEQESMGRGHPQSKADIISHDTDDEDEHHAATSSSSAAHAALPPRPDAKDKGKESMGRRMKDKMTGTTHDQRVTERKQRAEEEQRLYEQHLRIRQAMSKAQQTGQPQFIGKDRSGKDLYIEPPSYSGGYGGYGGGYGVSPYQNGIYTTPNARYIRPQQPYGRPYGGGYGGGYGLPLAMGMGGGLMGGLLLGDMMSGGMGGGMGMGMGGMGMGM